MSEFSAQKERTYGLVIGIESYQENSWNVKGGGPADDALKFAQWLLKCGVPKENIRLCLSPLEKVEHPELASEEATETKISALITDWLSDKKGDLLYLFWAGHGLITSERNRRLLCADATKRNWQNLDLDSLLVYLSSEAFPIKHHICIIDACASYILESKGRPTNLGGKTFPSGQPRKESQQFVLLATREGEQAKVSAEGKTGYFSQAVREALAKEFNGIWPPDMEVIAQNVKQRFAELDKKQLPTYFYRRSWDGDTDIYHPNPFDIPHNTKFDLFLAPNNQDKPQVRVIARELKRRGLKPWLDEEQISPGRSFQEVLQQAIPNVNSAAIFIGSRGLGDWEAMELWALIRQSVEADIPVIPVLLPGVERIPEPLLFLKEFSWVRFASEIDDAEALDNLEWGITGRKPEPTRLPETLIDCTGLKNLLAAGRWREANEATRTLLLKVAGQENECYLTDEQIQKFPGSDLDTIDTLWVNYSNERFGFSVQKRIMKECQGDPKAFGERVGWHVQSHWISASTVIYNPTNTPKGHLPWGVIQVITMDNAALTAFVNTLRWGTKALAKQDWQRQVIADFMALGGFLLADKIDKEEIKRNLEYELSFKEAWWEGQRIEELKVRKLFSLLVACQEL